MLSFIGRRSATIVFASAIVGLFLAGVEILLSAYIVKLLSMIGFSQPGNGTLQMLMGSISTPSAALLGFVIISIVRSILQIAKGYFAVSSNELFVTRLRLACISSTLNKVGPRYNSSRVYSLISDVFIKSALTFYGVAHAIPFIIQGLLLFVFLLSLSASLSLLGLLFVFLAGIIVFVIQRQISKVVSPLSKINDVLYKSLKRILENILWIRFCKLEDLEVSHAENLLQNYLKRIKRGSLLSLISENVPSLMGSVVVAILFLKQLHSPEVNAGVFISFIYVFMRFVQSLSQVVSFLSSSMINLPYFKSAYCYYNSLPKADLIGFDVNLLKMTNGKESDFSAHNILYSDRTTLSSSPTIKINKLQYQYDEYERIFNELSFFVKPGQQCVIIGPSGVGKSTLLNLMVGELQPCSGDIKINDVSPTTFLDTYSHEAAYAGPEPLLFEGSIRENLLYGANHEISDKEIIETLESLGLRDWLVQFEADLSQPLLGTDGVGASSGQAQRLSIARALLRRPKLLILDEVTANLDSTTEARVLSILELLKGEATVIIVTHSREMMKNANVIVDLGEGRVTQQEMDLVR